MKTRGEKFAAYLHKIGFLPWIARYYGLIEVNNGEMLTARELMMYPPATHGTPAQKVDEIIMAVKPMIKKIQHEAGIDDRESLEFNFGNLYLGVIRQYIEYIHLLPASENWHHSEHGGLLYHSLETSWEALKAFNNSHFERNSTADIEVLRYPRWRYATWLTALLHDAGKPISDCRVICMKSGLIWGPHMMSLIEWCQLHDVQRYKVQWKPERLHKGHESLAIHMLPKVLTDEAKRYLTNGPDDVYEEVGRVLASLEHSPSGIAKAVRTADSRSTSRDIQKTWDRQLGEKNTSTVMLIVKGLRAKLSEWIINEPKGHVWIINKEVYLAWPKAIQEVIEYLRKKNVAVPADTNTVYNMLYENHIIRNPDKDSKTTLFLPGIYTEEDAKKIRNKNISVTWEFLVRVVWADYVFEGVPMPNSMTGILKLNRNFDMVLIKESGIAELPAQSQANNSQASTSPAQSQANNSQASTSPAQSQANNSQASTPPAQSQANNSQPGTPLTQSKGNNSQTITSPVKPKNANKPVKEAKASATQTLKKRKTKKVDADETQPFNPVQGTDFSQLVAAPEVKNSPLQNTVENEQAPQVHTNNGESESTSVSKDEYKPSKELSTIKSYIDQNGSAEILIESNGHLYFSPINALRLIPSLGSPTSVMASLQDNQELERKSPELIAAHDGAKCNVIRLTKAGAQYISSKNSEPPAMNKTESQQDNKQSTPSMPYNSQKVGSSIDELLHHLAKNADKMLFDENQLYLEVGYIHSVCADAGKIKDCLKTLAPALGETISKNGKAYVAIINEYIDRFEAVRGDK
ncbi:MobH family relaxase [Motilimonas eburnea]|uniref:MobH family relaxase n=1 Tax=Motilimonas eburnea TaxID=1737488 RepID=UPI001E358F4C|nr:MobH family relaxase [Motilimonas eburnea]MCE2571773.1 TraI domain-containing protein [Motilimonas eburnea]